MTKKILFYGLILGAIFTFNYCQKTDNISDIEGTVEFSVLLNDGLKTISEDSSEYSSCGIIISVKSDNGDMVLTDHYVPLLKFGTALISSKIELQSGDYQLTKFMVIRGDNEVIYASPLEGSPKSYLVIDPLPIHFRVNANKSTLVSPEVLPVKDSQPEDFGYVSFQVNVVNVIKLFTAVRVHNPLSMAPIDWFYSEAKVLVSAGNWMHTYDFDANVNMILLRGNSREYKFMVTTADTDTAIFTFSLKELLKTSENNPLFLDINITQTRTLEIQPGPDKGKDATITDLDPNGNYGNSPFWYAGFVSEPVLTVMRTSKSLIHFDLNSLPKSATIQKVYLNLYISKWPEYIMPNDTGEIWMYWGAVLQQIVEPWSEDSVTWNNQPATITANQVFIDYHPELDFLGRTYDVTSLFVPVQEIAAPNYGIMIVPPPYEQISPPLYFASSDTIEAGIRPKLIIEYTLP